MQQPALAGNIWKYTLASIFNKRIFVAIIGAYYLTIEGVTAQTIGLLLFCGSFAGFLFEIPSGYVSDKIGHKKALIISRVLMAISSLCFWQANSVMMLIIALVFMNAGAAFHSGTGSAFMHETLKGLGREKDYSRVMGKIGAIGFSVPIVLTVLVPFLVAFSYKLPFLIMFVLDILGLCMILSLVTPEVEAEHVEEIRSSNFKQVIKEGMNLNYFSIAWFSGILGGLTWTIASFRAPYQIFLEVPVIWYGVFVGIGRGLASLMMAYSGRLTDKFSLISFYKFSYIVQILLIISLGLIGNSIYAVSGFILIAAFQWGLSKSGEGYQISLLRSSKFKATLLSVAAQIENIVGAVLGGFTGFLIQRYSYMSTFLYVGLGGFILLSFLYVKMEKKYKGGAYRIDL